MNIRNRFLAILLALPLAAAGCSRADKLESLDKKVHQLYEASKYAEAAKAAEEALTEAEQRAGSLSAPQLMTPLNNLAGLHRLCGRPKDAADVYRRMVEIDTASGANDDDKVLTYHDLATVSLESQ